MDDQISIDLENADTTQDRFHEECAIMAVWNHPEAANLCYLGLYAQQHRGQEGAGVVANQMSLENAHSSSFKIHKGLGLVAEVFHNYDFTKLPGNFAVGHVRYTTAGGNLLANVQPFFSEVAIGNIAICHNGNLVNADSLRKKLIKSGAIFGSTSDTEVILHLIAQGPQNVPLVETIISALKQIEGAYSLSIMCENRLFVVRDPNGLRPLCIGKLGETLVFASETVIQSKPKTTSLGKSSSLVSKRPASSASWYTTSIPVCSLNSFAISGPGPHEAKNEEYDSTLITFASDVFVFEN